MAAASTACEDSPTGAAEIRMVGVWMEAEPARKKEVEELAACTPKTKFYHAAWVLSGTVAARHA
jgi:hypothetical protein